MNTTIFKIGGCMVGVVYPKRITPDLFLSWEGWTLCCQCDSEFPTQQLKAHIHWHEKPTKALREKIKAGEKC